MSIRHEVRAFIEESFFASADFADDASLMDTGTIDSTGVLEIIAFLDERYGISVRDSEIHPDNFDTVSRLVGYVERRRNEAPSGVRQTTAVCQ